MSDDDNDGHMIFGDLGGLKLSDICLTGEEKTRKNLTQETYPDGDRTWARCVTGAHATACPTAVDFIEHVDLRLRMNVGKFVIDLMTYYDITERVKDRFDMEMC